MATVAVALTGALVTAPGARALPPPNASMMPDVVRSQPWLGAIGWTPARAYGSSANRVGAGDGIRLIVIDSGVSLANPDFAYAGGLPGMRAARLGYGGGSGQCVASKWQSFDGQHKNAIADGGVEAGHGTTVTALASAPIDGSGIVGAAPEVALVVIAMRPPDPGELGSTLACALQHAAAAAKEWGGATVVNLSLQLGGPASPGVVNGIQKLVGEGALIIAAAGNIAQGATANTAPARLWHVLSVGDAERKAHPMSPYLDVLAPGAGYPLALANGTYQTSGAGNPPATSYAAPLVSGLAATIWSLREETAQQIGYRLRRSTSTLGRWVDGRTGFGTVNLKRALDTSVPRDDEIEPNDTPALARTTTTGRGWARFTCTSHCNVLAGIAGATDDPDDWFIVQTRTARSRPCPRFVRHTTGVALHAPRLISLRGALPRVWAIGVHAAGPLTSYQLTATIATNGRC